MLASQRQIRRLPQPADMVQPTFRTNQERLGNVNQQAPLGAERQELLAATSLDLGKSDGGKLIKRPTHGHD